MNNYRGRLQMRRRTQRYYKRPRLGQTRESSSILKEDYLQIAYYLYFLTKGIDDIPMSLISFICNLVRESNNYDKAKSILSTEIATLEKNHILQLREDCYQQQNPNGFEITTVFDDTNISFKYTIDKQINSKYSLIGNYIDLQLDIYRVIACTEDNYLADIIGKIFLFKEGTNKIMSVATKKTIFSTNKVNFLIEKVGLSKLEALFLLVQFRFINVRLLDGLSEDYCGTKESLMCDILQISTSEYRKLIRADQNLKAYGFIDEENFINEDFIDCILDQSLEPFFADFLKPLDCSDAFEASSFAVPQETTKIMQNLINRQESSSILLYGKPGSGKTQYAKMLAKNSGCKVYLYKNENEVGLNNNLIGRLNCYLSIKQRDSIIIIDEADKVLQTLNFNLFKVTPTASKGTVNKMLEENKNKSIWIINHTAQLDESTRRRFTMSYKFSDMPVSILRSITRDKLKPLSLSEPLEESLLSLFDRFSVTGASISNIVKTIDSLKEEDDATLIRSVKTVLEENAKLLDGNTSRMRDTVSKAYDPTVINTSISAEKIINMVENAIKFSERNYGCESGIRMLFYGVSGTGKTELVRYISEKLNKKITLKRASDILGSYVGDNEHHIKEAFEEAAQNGNILLFDEADSFFANRADAKHSWERTTTNEFLTQMEEFPGIVICTTNLKNIMDPAMIRRFNIMVEFKALKQEGISTLLGTYFADYNFTQEQVNKIASSNTATPGDFGALSSRIRFMDKDDISSQFITEQLCEIQKDKNNVITKKVGFLVE